MRPRLACLAALLASCSSTPEPSASFDLVVYGGTSGGVVAAVQAARLGKTVLLIEPTAHLGGLSTSGLGATDIGNKAAIGGIAREFYRRIGAHYAREEAWVHEARSEFRGRGHENGDDAAWTFEPHVAEAVFERLVEEPGLTIWRSDPLQRDGGVQKDGERIAAITTLGGRTARGKVFVDATYEGDLLAAAGVRYTIGREANGVYGETLNGVQTKHATHHQFIRDVSGYVVPGDPASGLLPGIDPAGPGDEGSGDHRVQAYCFRVCTTDVPENRGTWRKPGDHDPRNYELLLRNLAAGDHRVPWHRVAMPNKKTDTNNFHAISIDFIGGSWDWPEASYAERERILAAHRSWQEGLFWTLANDPRVPAKVAAEFREFGPALDEFTDNDHWPWQVYVREARRMVSDYVMTEHDCRGTRRCDDPVGLAAYTMDSHNVQRWVDQNGIVRNEGDVQVGGFPPYPISYRSIVPARGQCENLFVPVCLSASHIAFGSIRMEPVFMVLGQSAAIAACMAIDAGVAVQDVDQTDLRERLLAAGQELSWPVPAPAGVK